MKTPALLLSLAFIVFLAGCVTKPPATGNGVAISSFGPELKEVTGTGGSSAVIMMTVKNNGGSNADWVEADLIGLPDSWNVKSEGGGDRTIKNIGSLAAADPEHGLPKGEEAFRTWDVIIPKHEVVQTYSFSARLFYSYKTVADGVVRVVSTDYFRSLSEEKQKTLREGVVSSATTVGPLSITIRAPEVLLDPKTTGSLPIIFEITNTGGGRVFKENANRPDGVSIDWMKAEGGGINCKTTNKEIRLIRGQSGRVSCTLNIDKAVTTFTDFSVKLTLSYKYFTEASSSMKVLKSLETLITPSSPTSGSTSTQPTPAATTARTTPSTTTPSVTQPTTTQQQPTVTQPTTTQPSSQSTVDKNQWKCFGDYATSSLCLNGGSDSDTGDTIYSCDVVCKDSGYKNGYCYVDKYNDPKSCAYDNDQLGGNECWCYKTI